jgi:hypothetical protein
MHSSGGWRRVRLAGNRWVVQIDPYPLLPPLIINKRNHRGYVCHVHLHFPRISIRGTGEDLLGLSWRYEIASGRAAPDGNSRVYVLVNDRLGLRPSNDTGLALYFAP